jgi:hypothetical protein
MADWDMQKKIPIQVSKLINTVVSIEKALRPINFLSKIYECPITPSNKFKDLSINSTWSMGLQPF